VPGGPFELTLRDWARRNAEVQKVIEEVDTERVAFLVRLYSEAGLGATRAKDSALAHMALTIGLRMVLFDGSQENLEQRWRIAKAFLVPRTAKAQLDKRAAPITAAEGSASRAPRKRTRVRAAVPT
jgi:hypothetical protein